MKGKPFWLTALSLVFMLSLMGCFGGGGESDEDLGPATEVSEGPRTDGQGEIVPDDIPIMPGAYKLDVFSNGTQVNFTIDGEIQPVMDYYAAELEALGWTPTRAPDSAMGFIGAMSRENERGDLLSLNFSYNANGNFVTVTIAVSRKG